MGTDYCTSRHERKVYFGKCYPAPGCPDESVMHTCSHDQNENGLVRLGWENPHCEGIPDHMFSSDICYPYSFSQIFDTFPSEFCDKYKIPRQRFYKYECRIPGTGWYHAENEAIGGGDDVPIDSHMNAGIVAAILLFVCFIGVIFGYLIHRRRKMKKSTQKRGGLLAFNEKENETD